MRSTKRSAEPEARRGGRLALRLLAASLLVGSSMAGCGGDGEQEDPDAGPDCTHEGQRFLCDAALADVWTDRVAACRTAWEASPESCGGVASVRGTVDGDPFTVEMDLGVSDFLLGEDSASGTRYMNRIDAVGPGPCFNVTLSPKSVGGIAGDTVDTVARTLTLNGNARNEVDHLLDDQVEMAIRLTAGDLNAVTGSGTIVVHAQSADELHATFNGNFGAEEVAIEGCMHAFGISSSVKPF